VSGFSLQAGQLRSALISAGLPADSATQIAAILGNSAQTLRHSGQVTHDRTPKNLKLVSPDDRRHTLPGLDFRVSDPDYRPQRTRSSEEREKPEQEPTVLNVVAPQQTNAAFRVKSGKYIDAVPAGDQVAVNLKVSPVGDGTFAAFIDPQANAIVTKTLRAAASQDDQSRVRFRIVPKGQELLWSLELQNVQPIEVVTGVEYKPGQGLAVTYSTVYAWKYPNAAVRTDVIATSSVPVVHDVELIGDQLVGQRYVAEVLGVTPSAPALVNTTDCDEPPP
jgi:hypothetical protein